MTVTKSIVFDRTFDLQGERIDIKQSRIEADEYVAFLARPDLGQQYP